MFLIAALDKYNKIYEFYKLWQGKSIHICLPTHAMYIQIYIYELHTKLGVKR